MGLRTRQLARSLANSFANATTTISSTSLSNTGVVANTYGNTTAIPVITISADGRITNSTTSSVSGVTGLSYTTANATIAVSTSATNYTANIQSSLDTKASLTGATFTGAVAFSNTISVVGNITGSSANVTIVAGAFSTIFANNGTTTFPGAVSGITTLAAGNTTITGFANVTSSLNVSGNIGIGTSSPSALLNIVGAPSSVGSIGMVVNDAGRTTQLQVTGSSYSYKGVGANEALLYASGGALSLLADGQPIKFCTDSERMRIASSGALGFSGANYGSSGQVLTSAGSGSAPSWSTPGGGKVEQVVQTVVSSALAQSGGAWPTFDDLSGYSINITPTSASSKVLFQISFGAMSQSTNSIIFRLVRNGTVIGVGDASSGRPQATFRNMREGDGNHTKTAPHFTYLDSPNTTSAVTYKLQWSGEGSPTVYINRAQNDTDNQSYGARTISTMTLWEIKA